MGTYRSLVNDLDLVVIAPSGDAFLGNVLKGGVSVSGGLADRLNNVEMVICASPEQGRWHLDVVAHEVNVRGGQGFALVVSGRVRAAAR